MNWLNTLSRLRFVPTLVDDTNRIMGWAHWCYLVKNAKRIPVPYSDPHSFVCTPQLFKRRRVIQCDGSLRSAKGGGRTLSGGGG